MRQSKFLKAITLTIFIILVSAFVAYRGGLFDNTITDSLSSNRGNILRVDSPPVNPTVFPSSKSMQLPPDLHKNSSNANQNTNTSTNSESYKKDSARRMEIMMSSKSGDIIRFDDSDTSKITTPVYMGSSKSRMMFEPKKDTSKKKK
ncbi:MAG: hypothetical protein K0S32_3568 [Bacteroidetes bacterium]|jgi:hypothetical protein|nr:hypothetical protein [Bacteroidota bacterium]